jgi:hypothetical protein
MLALRGDGHPQLDDIGYLMPGRDQLEDSTIDFPVAKLFGAIRIMTQVRDVQAVGEIVEHDATLTAEHSDRPRLVQRLNLKPAYPLPPVPGRRLKSQVLGRRAGGEQDDSGLVRADAGLVGRSLVGG